MPDTLTAPDPPATHGLTPRQADTLRAIFAHLEEHGRLPTIRELTRRMGVRHNAAHWHVAALAEMGWLEYSPRRGMLGLKGVSMMPVLDDSPEAQRLMEVLDARPV